VQQSKRLDLGKGVPPVPAQYRPSGRGKEQEGGPMGAGGAWLVRPIAPATPGKQGLGHIVCYIACYDIAYDVGALYRMF
jgi:hypothetical protein